MIEILESNGFFPRAEDLEAILRRCDHDADRALSFEEFSEVTEGLKKVEAPAEDNEQPKESSEKKEEAKTEE